MARYKLYCVGASGNSYEVALYLNCASLDGQPVGVDFAGDQMRDAGWRAENNGMGEIPVLEVDGRRLSQSGQGSMFILRASCSRVSAPKRQ